MYNKLDKEFYDSSKEAAMQCGAVVSTCVMLGNMLFCVNAGDCRAVLCRSGKAVNMSLDHKSSRKSEVRRVKMLGGYVYHGRVFGRLMITRSFGDFEFKIKLDMNMKAHEVNYISSAPEIRYTKVNFETDRFLLMASDGLFDKMTS
mmetsp:Transcript_29062/g.38717  ORF Transcript_29062/g.38717 Transcript_29062/m.38717 type:complete len:146 (+) Transcript_29062:1113-1550(+)|eukprot:CAMPEP_0185575238 /NCGR_PEP_ID=MMETSP0434-20130131/6490_1 /TAXON_ID=626734 ORGANISM="Favella taraikaensis, Strain Fe Narragansett Bay" /NCGR_SAMPLE_ID=MMETSP0434 /ASSEMBLY_ACC=CAM_ASM_000379 /LENGTH=145 /DNA_ID=CAMNT_0028192059 /DNA_START=1100 /DNA_END=1537 /DNA_ORIENTATION=+